MDELKGKKIKIILCLEDEIFLQRLKDGGVLTNGDRIINTATDSLKVTSGENEADVLLVDSTFEANNHNLLTVISSKFPKALPILLVSSPENIPAAAGMHKYSYIYTANEEDVLELAALLRSIRTEKSVVNRPEFPPQEVFNAILKNMAEGFMYVDTDDAILYINKQFCNMVGYEEDELLGKKGYTILIAKEDQEKLLSKNEARINNVSDHYEIRMVKKGGEVIWVSVIGTPVTNAEGSVIGSIGIISDITKSKQSEIFLRRFSGLLDTLLSHVTVALLEIDTEGRIVYSAGKVFENLGMTKEDLMGNRLGDMFNAVGFTLRTGETYPVPVIVQRLLSGEFIVGYTELMGFNFENYFTPLYAKYGELSGGVIFAFDITERISIQKQIKETEDKYQTLVENINDIIISITRDYKIGFISPVVRKLLGYNPEEMAGMPVQEYIYAPDSLPFRDGVMAVFTGITRPIEFRAITKMGTLRWLRASLIPHYENGKIISAQGIFSDIQEKKEIEFKLIQAKERAEEVSRLKSYFLANMSHELRTPMIGILGYAEILLDELTDTELQKMASIIFNSGNRLLETLNLILDLSKIESGKLEIQYVEIDVREEIQNCLSTFEQAAHKRNLTLEMQGGMKAKLHVDKRLFRDTMNNLLSNAIKFTHIGGVTVEYYIEKTEHASNVVIMVTDTGIGIPERSLNLIFEEFQQVSQGYGREYEGTGLGLSVTKKFIESMGGLIKVKSKQGVGSTFTVILPMKK